MTQDYAKRNQHPNYSSPLRAQRIAEAAKKRWADPEFRKKMEETVFRDPESYVGVAVTIDGVEYPTVSAACRANPHLLRTAVYDHAIGGRARPISIRKGGTHYVDGVPLEADYVPKTKRLRR